MKNNIQLFIKGILAVAIAFTMILGTQLAAHAQPSPSSDMPELLQYKAAALTQSDIPEELQVRVRLSSLTQSDIPEELQVRLRASA